MGEIKTVAHVVSATELREEQIAALKAALSRKLDKPVDVIARVEPALLGGLRIHVDGYLIDSSIRTQLRDMKNSIVKRDAG